MKIIYSGLIVAFCFILYACGSDQSRAKDNEEKQEIIESQPEQTAESDDIAEEGFAIRDNAFIPDSLPMIVDFNATWCPPCQKFKPIFEEAKEKYVGQAIFLSVDTDKYPDLARMYEVESIPTVVFIMPGGGLQGKQVGFLSAEQFDTFINQLLATAAGESLSL